MAAIRIYLDGERTGPLFRRATQRQGDRVREAMRGAASDAAVEIEERGAANIEEGGNFGSRWTDAFKADVTEGGGNIRIDVGFDGDEIVSKAWPVFEFGATIEGKPLLWIPLTGAGIPQGLWARDYAGALFRTTRKSDGLPLLGDVETGEMKYFGKEYVVEPRKWQLREIVRQVAKEIGDYFRDRMS